MASSHSTSVLLRNAGFHVGWQRKRGLVFLYSSGERDEGPHVKTSWAGYLNHKLVHDVLKAWQRMSGGGTR
jgi:hypothetical protein